MKRKLIVELVVLVLIVASCASGNGLVNLTRNPRAEDMWPSWSPDGSKILFMSAIFDTSDELPIATDHGIYVMDADGRNRTKVIDPPGARSPSWSPDGKRIVYAVVAGIFAVDADGTNITPVIYLDSVFGPLFDWPSYSPDGTKILFASQRERKWQIYVVNVDGSNETRLSPEEVKYEYRPSWSPDGTRIVFDSYRDGNREIYVMNADGSNPIRLTKDPPRQRYGDCSPVWSPDGNRIAFISNRDGQRDIYVMNADGSNVTRLTNNSISEASLTWSPDGRKIAFDSEDRIYVVDVPLD
jgi:Tol biopolymer transport system component